MSIMNSKMVKEALTLFHSYQVDCDEELVQEWLNDNHTKKIQGSVTEEHVWAFNEWLRLLDTAYEEGIDDKTKIERLTLEIQSLEKENNILRDKNALLERELGISPFD